MKRNTLFLSVLFISTVFAMDPSIKDQTQEIVQKMLDRTRPMYENKVEQVLNKGTFAEHSLFDPKRDAEFSREAYTRFGMLADLCDHRYIPLLETLLQSKKASANTSLTLATGTRITLFTEAIVRSVKDTSSLHNRFSAVELLLSHGADPNQEGISLSEHDFCRNKNYKDEICLNTPLFRYIADFNEDLVKLLLSYDALPDKHSQKVSPLMQMLFHYDCCNGFRIEDKMKAYKILQALLDKKADVL